MRSDNSAAVAAYTAYLALRVFPGSIDQVNGEDFHAQTSLHAINHNVQAFVVPDYKARVIQFIRDLFEVQAGILYRRKTHAK